MNARMAAWRCFSPSGTIRSKHSDLTDPTNRSAKAFAEQSTAPHASDGGRTFRVTHPFHPLHGRTFRLIDWRQTWGEHRVYFYDDSGQLARLLVQWTDVEPEDPTVVVGAGRAHFRYDDLCRLADLVIRLANPEASETPDEC